MKRKVFDTLLKYYKEKSFELSSETITESIPYKNLEAKYDEVRKRNDACETRIRNLERDNKSLSEDVQKNSEQGSITSEQVSDLKEKIHAYEAQLEQFSEMSNIQKDIENLKEEQKNLESQNEYLRGQKIKLESKLEEAKNSVKAEIKSGIDESAKIAFDPFISNEMLNAAARWAAENEQESYEKNNAELSNMVASDITGDDLVDYVVEYVKSRRNYSKNDIINIYISISQSFLTVFSGEPGTGKTSMCGIISDSLGLNSFGEDYNRFVPVSVERGWSSKRDFIGYFNPLTRKYDKSNSKVYDALRKLDCEGENSYYPFMIMLDEANLSPMEYYWADFMRLTDRTTVQDTFINIGTEKELFVPETLRFVATINTDQTTEMLSPRLIDRACIIKLPNVKPKSVQTRACSH